jgi:AraC family transcriptional regulator
MSDTRSDLGLTSLTRYQELTPGQIVLRNQEEWGDFQLRGRIYAAEQDPIPVPGIPQLTLTFVYGGQITGIRRTGGGPWNEFDVYSKGHVTIRPAGRSTSIGFSAGGPVRTLSLYLPPERLEEVGLQMGMAPSQVEIPDHFNQTDPFLQRLAEELRRMAAGGRPIDPLYLETAQQTLGVRLLREYNEGVPAPSGKAGRLSLSRLHQVERYVRAHLADDVRLDDLAEEVGLSKYHFSRRFKRRTGQSPYQFVIYERVRAARRLLRETSWPLARIAFHVGFSSQSHLTRTFKQHTGVTPGAYRAAWR